MTDRKYVLVAVETAQIQSYIFASNRLRENVGASYLVAAATGEWALKILKAMPIRTNITNDTDTPFSSERIEDGLLDAEVLYSGGGNIVLLFAETIDGDFDNNELPKDAKSRQFIRTLSRRVQREAPGLTLTFNAMPFDWADALSAAVGELLKTMKEQRSYQPALRGDGGQAVQMMCASTSLPAVIMVEDPRDDDSDPINWRPYSAETLAKRDAALIANKFLRNTLTQNINTASDYDFPLDFDHLGRSKEDTSYVAVVHADGNGLGILIQGLQNKFSKDKNRAYITYMREFSQGIKKVALEAQREMVKIVVSSIKDRRIASLSEKTKDIELKQDKKTKNFFLPLRPLVSGGDDVTFVCDARIALDLAVIFLQKFEKYTQEILGEKLQEFGISKLTACAGVAMVKTHYPFARAYTLADELAGNAKQLRHQQYPDNVDAAPSALDWHITAGGLYDDLDEMRKREYCLKINETDKTCLESLALRPVFVELGKDHTLYARSWEVIKDIIKEFQRKWDDHRNKAEGLREVLRKGETETAIYKARYLTQSQSAWSRGKPPYLPEIAGFEEKGWLEINNTRYYGYYDALELMDKYIPLKTQEKPQS